MNGAKYTEKKWNLQVAEKESKRTQALVDAKKHILQKRLSLAAE